MYVMLQTGLPDPATLAAAAAVHAAAFADLPYRDRPPDTSWFARGVQRYAAGGRELRLVTVRDHGGVLQGVGLAVISTPESCWQQQLATQLPAELRAQWLGPRVLRIDEIAVHPDAQRRGLGRIVLDSLVAGSPAPTGLLACHPHGCRPYRLCTARNWNTIGRQQVPDGEPYYLLGRTL